MKLFKEVWNALSECLITAGIQKTKGSNRQLYRSTAKSQNPNRLAKENMVTYYQYVLQLGLYTIAHIFQYCFNAERSKSRTIMLKGRYCQLYFITFTYEIYYSIPLCAWNIEALAAP